MLLRIYPDSHFAPERGNEHNWHVWCRAGALQVLQTGDYSEWLTRDPSEPYTINFANGGYADTTSDHPLWAKLTEIAATYSVEVFTGHAYVAWTGREAQPGFDAIRISLKAIDTTEDDLTATIHGAAEGDSFFRTRL